MTQVQSRPKELKARWFSRVPEDQKELQQANIKAWMATPTTTKLVEILELRIKQLESDPDYDNPNWANKMAHMNGQRSMLKEIKELITP